MTMQIDSYEFGSMTVEGNRYTEDLIIYPDRVEPGWFRERGHSLSVKDLDGVVEYGPDNLIMGLGAYGRVEIPEETRKFLKDKGIRLLSGNTQEMSELFNEHMREGRRTAGAFHLTC